MTLHAVWFGGSLHLWADRPRATAHLGNGHAANSDSPPTLGSVAPADVALVDHPRALTHEQLRDAVGEITGDGLLPQAATPSTLTLHLPHDTRGTLSAGEEPEGLTHLAPVVVPTLLFPPSHVADVLTPLREDPPDAAGESLGYYARLHRYVVAKIAAKQFFPDLDQYRAGSYVGVWRLVTTGGGEALAGEVARLSAFASAMPPVARAAASEEPLEPGRLVETFVAASADAFIRRAVSTDPFFTRVHELALRSTATGDVRWLSALLGRDNVLRGGSTESNVVLNDLVRSWVSRLDEGRASEPWKLVLSLREPTLPEDFDEDVDSTDGGDLIWPLRLQFKSPGEDGSLIDAEDLWGEDADPAGVFGRSVSERKAQLMTDLARAAELCPLLAPLAASDAPSEMTLPTADANAFIRAWTPPLRSAGFSVELPEWAERRERGLGLLLTVRPMDGQGDDETLAAFLNRNRPNAGVGEISSGQFGLESLLDFDWQIAVGDMRLSPAEFKALSQKGSPLVRYKGQWIQIDPDAGAKAAGFLASGGKGKMTLAQALRTAYGIVPADTGLPVIGLSGKGWIEQLLSQTPAIKLAEAKQPTEFQGSLRPYQLRGLQWMWFLDRLGLGGCLADDMGLGKTVQLISLLLAEREELATLSPNSNTRIGPTLLFAPTSVVGNWLKEVHRFAPKLKVLVHHGPDRRSGDDFASAVAAADIVITSYALAHRDIEDLRKPQWHRVAVDEAQKIKNPAAAATVAIRSINAPRRIALTGTPIENHLSELWSIMELLNPGLLGTAADFRDRFAVPVEKLGDKARAAQLRRMIQPFVLRRSKNDPAVAGDLPEKLEMKVYCHLTAEQAAMYERITAEMLGQIDTATGIRRRGLILAALTRLKQICDHPSLIDPDNNPAPALDRRSGKCERILEMLEEVVQEGDAALVFTQYREMGHLLEKLITDRLKTNVQFLHGGTTARQRDAMIERFQAPNSDIKVFLLSLRAGGLGLNLTAANHVFHFDRWWNPAVEQQATDRAHRIGQTRKVQVHQFVCVGTLEERIDKLLQDKLQLADQVVGHGDDWLTDMSTDQLRQYLSLGRDAVGEF
jgi:hypothetical protein